MESTSKPYKILIRDKKGCFSLSPFLSKTDKEFKLEECSHIISSKNHFCILNNGHLSLYLTKDFNIIKDFNDLELVAAVDFSPSGNYLTIIQKPTVGNENLKIYDISNNNDIKLVFCLHSTTHPKSEWPQISYSKNDELFFFHNKNSIEIYDKEKNLIGKLENIIAYEIAEYINDKEEKENLLLVGKNIQINEKKKVCYFSVYNIKDLSKPMKEIEISLTDRMKLRISPDNKYILVNAINDNTSNKSYYGQSNLYYYNLQTMKFTKFNLPEGPIHDFCWLPNGENFIIVAGHLPSKTSFYDKNGNYIKEIVIGKFNNIKISPDSRILALCGFGSLNGDVEYYNLENYELIGKSNFFCCVNFEWSEDSKYILGAVLSTRVKVDNEYRILKYNGEEVIVDKDIGEIYDCIWLHDDNVKYEKFNIEKNVKSLEEKKKAGIQLKTLGKIDFSNSNNNNNDTYSGGIVGLGKKKKKKKKGGQP